MDYTYFTPAPQQFQFFNLPPTPAHSHTPHGEDENLSPPDHFDNPYQHFDPSFPTFDDGSVIAAHNPAHPPPHLANKASYDQSGGAALHEVDGNGMRALSMSEGNDDMSHHAGRSSSEEKESLTPAQSRRKAQNRAAQRAFRERKERHVKDLEQKLNNLEEASSSLHDENERLKRELAKIATENEILRATSAMNGHDNGMAHEEELTTAPLRFSPTDFVTTVVEAHRQAQVDHERQEKSGEKHQNVNSSQIPPAQSPRNFQNHRSQPPHHLEATRSHSTSRHHQPFTTDTDHSAQPNQINHYAHRVTFSPTTGEKLLNAGATWDLIQEHELFTRGLVDVGDVSERLKKVAQCDGQGPVFAEGEVRRIIEESVAGGRDELI